MHVGWVGPGVRRRGRNGTTAIEAASGPAWRGRSRGLGWQTCAHAHGEPVDADRATHALPPLSGLLPEAPSAAASVLHVGGPPPAAGSCPGSGRVIGLAHTCATGVHVQPQCCSELPRPRAKERCLPCEGPCCRSCGLRRVYSSGVDVGGSLAFRPLAHNTSNGPAARMPRQGSIASCAAPPAGQQAASAGAHAPRTPTQVPYPPPTPRSPGCGILLLCAPAAHAMAPKEDSKLRGTLRQQRSSCSVK